MSFEVMWEEDDACRCGQGIVRSRLEADDWNRMRRSFETRCFQCALEGKLEARMSQAGHEFREECLQEAQALAEKRYLPMWLDRFKGCSAKHAWLKLTGGQGYPSLGTFYKHLRDHGSIGDYMRWRFFTDIRRALQILAVSDPEIEALLKIGIVRECVGPM